MGEVDRREAVRTVLEAARVEITNAIARVDRADATELARLTGAAQSLVAFVDFNDGCGAAALNTTDLIRRLRG